MSLPMINKLLKIKVEETVNAPAIKLEGNMTPDQELDSNVSDDDHISNKIPDSNIKVTAQFNPVIPEITVAQPSVSVKNPVTKFVQIQNPTSPGGHNSPPKANNSPMNHLSAKLGFKELSKERQAKLQNDDKSEINDTEGNKKPANVKLSNHDLMRASKLKPGEQTGKSPLHKALTLTNKNEKGYSEGSSSPDKKIKVDDGKGEYASDVGKKSNMHQLQSPQSNSSKTQNFELVLSPYAAKEIENRKNMAQKELQEALGDRLLKQGEVLNEHSKALIESYLQKEFEECTFNPMINAYGNYENKRSTNQFLEDQKKFLDLIELKKQKIKNKIETEQKLVEGTYKPELCKKSLKILEKKKKQSPSIDEDVHSRLYKVNKNAQQKQMQDIAQNEEALEDSNTSSQFIGQLSRVSPKTSVPGEGTVTFVPNIHKKSKRIRRENKIDTILYNDAMRRAKKSLAQSTKQQQKPKKPANNMSEESRKALAARFIREFEIVFTEKQEGDKEQKMDYIQLNEFLKKLYFLKDADKVDLPQFTPERILLYDMWYTMFADKFKGVHRRNLLVFLLAVMGLNYEITKIQGHGRRSEIHSNNDDSEAKRSSKLSLDKEISMDENSGGPPVNNEILPRERKIIGCFDEDQNLELTAEEVEKIHKIYNLWFVNRLGSKDNLGHLLTSKRYEEPSYHPVINENSKNIAHLYREKILEGTAELIQQNKMQAPKDGKLTHADLLVLSKKVVKEKVEKFKASQEGNELRFCTFKPMTNDYFQSSRMQKKGNEFDEVDENETERKQNPSGSIGKERALDLYSLRKPIIDKKNRDPYDIEYEKNCDQCTFQPDLRLTKDKKVDAGTPIMAKNIEKTIQRLRQANDARDQKNLWNQRGYYPQGQEAGLVFGGNKDSKFKQNELPQRPAPGSNYRRLQEPSPRGLSLRSVLNQPGYSGNYYNSIKEARNKAVAQYDGEEPHDSQGDENDQQPHERISGRDNGEEDHHQDEHEDNAQPVDTEHREADDHENPETGERVPLLFVDVNLGAGNSERIIVYEGDKSEVLAKQFADEHGLDDLMAVKLKELLDSQIAGLLTRIDEELNSLQSETDKNDPGNMEIYRNDDQIDEEDDQDY